MRANNFPGLTATQRKIRSGELQLPLLELCAHDLGELGRQFAARNWVPANTGDFSVRLDRMALLITRADIAKADLTKNDVIRMGLDGRSLTSSMTATPHATPLHCMIYQRDPNARSVLHSHSMAATILSLNSGDELRCGGMEIQRALPTSPSLDDEVVLPIFNNNADAAQLAKAIERQLNAGLECHNAFLVRGHGLYAWGASIEAAKQCLEAWEFLMEAELIKRQIAGR